MDDAIKKVVRVLFLWATLALVLSYSGVSRGETKVQLHQIPDEYESASGHSIALNNAAVAATDGASAIRSNPALLAKNKQYTVTGGYHWPMSGRDYYQASIVDGKTSSVAAGLTYTSFPDNYAYVRDSYKASPYDAPIVRRGVVGVGQAFGGWFLGIGGTYVEGCPIWSQSAKYGPDFDRNERIKGFGVNLGLATALTHDLDLGMSVENASNQKISDYAPRTYRAGIAYRFLPTVQGLLDIRQRDRVMAFEGDQQVSLEPKDAEASGNLAPEQMIIGAFEAQIQDFLRFTASYAGGINNDRKSLSGGLAVVTQNISLSYTVARPYMASTAMHQAIAVSIDVTM